MCNSPLQSDNFNDYFHLSFLIGENENSGDRILTPSDIAEDPDGNFYIADESSHQIKKFSSTGKYLKSFGSEGTNPGEFRYPTSLSISYRGDITVTDRWNHRIQTLDPDGKPKSSFGSYGKEPGNFNEPWGLSVCPNGNMLIADRGNHRIQVFTRDGKFQYSFGKAGFDNKYYESDEFKTGYVFECWHERISRFSPIETSFHESGYEVGNLEFPRWIVRYQDNNYLVTDTSGAIHIVESEGTFANLIEFDFSDDEGRYIPASAAVTSSETTLICDECRKEVIAIKPDLYNKTVLTGIPYPVSNLRFLPSGKLALIHCWNNVVSLYIPINGI